MRTLRHLTRNPEEHSGAYEKILELVNRKVLLPPLGMVTGAALCPDWSSRLADRNVREVTESRVERAAELS